MGDIDSVHASLQQLSRWTSDKEGQHSAVKGSYRYVVPAKAGDGRDRAPGYRGDIDGDVT